MDLVSNALGVRLDHVLRSAPVGIAVFDAAGRYLWVNETAAAANGTTGEVHHGRRLEDVAPALAATHGPIVGAVLAGGPACSFVSERPIEPGGPPRNLAEHLFPIRAEDGSIVGVANVWWEITDVLTEARAAGEAAEAERAAREVAEAARDRIRFLADATASIAEPLDEAAILDRLVRLAVPHLADWAAVYTPAGGLLHRVAVVHAEAIGGPNVVAMPAAPPLPIRGNAPAAVAFRTREAQLITRPEPQRLREHAPEQVADVFRRLDLRSGMSLPILSTGGEVLGVIAFAFSGQRGVPGALDVALATELAARAGVALDHARRFDRQRAVADALQRAVLPSSLPALPGLALAGRFLPSSARAGVGGDWYDVVPVGGRRLLLGIGDVVGHGLAAVDLMAQMRVAFRAYALEGHPPGGVARLLARFVEDDDVFVTALIAELDSHTGDLCYVNAGHPPPMVLAPGARARLLEGADPPLGAAPSSSWWVERAAHLAPGETLLLYTDGLVERRSEALDVSIAAVAESALSMAAAGVSGLIDALVANAGTASDDDVCLLAVQRLGGGSVVATGGTSPPPT